MLRLPCFTVDLSGDRPVVRTPRADGSLRAADLRAGELTQLVGLDEGVPSPPWAVERCVPLVDDRWAVGRRTGPRVVWRLVGADDLDRLGHPAWLWSSDDWLDPRQAESATHPVPAQLPLRTLVKQARDLDQSGRRTIKALAGTIAVLRGRRPVALITPPQGLEHAAMPARAFVLALLTILPHAWRKALRVSVGEPEPRPAEWDLVLTPQEVDGYRTISLEDPPDEGSDLVAYFVRNRLMADDAEAVEAAALQERPHPPAAATRPGAPKEDDWGELVAAALRDGDIGWTELTDEAIAEEPERAVRALTARLRAGAPLDDRLLERLVAVTRVTRDPRPWMTFSLRPAVQRARAVQAILPTREELRPGPELVKVLAATYPRGASLDAWVPTLLAWLHRGVSTEAVMAALQSTLLEWPLAATRATRASVWSEVVYGLVALGLDELAMDALGSDVAKAIAADGAARALAANWTVIPLAFRDHARMDRLVRLFASAPDGDAAVLDLYLHVKQQPEEAMALFTAWLSERSDTLRPTDPLLDATRGTPDLDLWMRALFAVDDPLRAADHLEALAADDPTLWEAAETALSAGSGSREALLSIPALRPGLHHLEARAVQRLMAWFAEQPPLPDPEVSEFARIMLRVPGNSQVWGLIAIATSAADAWDDAILDGAVIDSFAEEPRADLRFAALAATDALGLAATWEPLDHARWLVRISLAPDPAGLAPDLALALLLGLLRRPDADAHVVGVIQELLSLPPEHPALMAFTHYLLGKAFADGVPPRILAAIPLESVPARLQSAWARVWKPC